MIASLHGTVAHVDHDSVVLDVNGVGYAVAVTAQQAVSLTVGDRARLHTHLIVREDALALVGFAERDELRVFALLLSVNGVGPKSALGVLSSLTVNQIADAVAAEDDAPFRAVSGIGPKTAKLMVVQLAGKLADLAGAPGVTARPAGVSAEVIAAVIGLGWPDRVANEAVTAVATEQPAEAETVQTLLRATLAYLGPARAESVHG